MSETSGKDTDKKGGRKGREETSREVRKGQEGRRRGAGRKGGQKRIDGDRKIFFYDRKGYFHEGRKEE